MRPVGHFFDKPEEGNFVVWKKFKCFEYDGSAVVLSVEIGISGLKVDEPRKPGSLS